MKPGKKLESWSRRMEVLSECEVCAYWLFSICLNLLKSTFCRSWVLFRTWISWHGLCTWNASEEIYEGRWSSSWYKTINENTRWSPTKEDEDWRANASFTTQWRCWSSLLKANSCKPETSIHFYICLVFHCFEYLASDHSKRCMF